MSKNTGTDRAKVHEKARRLALKGDVRKAVATLAEHIAEDAADDRALLLLADFRRRAGDDDSAVTAFTAAADLYTSRGFALRAAACLRQALQIASRDVALLERLADVNADLGLHREAADALEEAASLVPTEDHERLVAIRRRLVELQPGAAGAAIRLADLLAADGRGDEAIALLERAAAANAEPAQEEVWIRVQERLCLLEPGNLARAKEVARRLVERGAPKRALSLVKPCLAAEPGDLDALRLVARAFVLLGLAPKAAETLREIAHLHQREGRAAEAKETWQKVRELVPDDPEATKALLPPRDARASLEEELAEADFLAGEGLVSEALAVLHRLREEHPDAEAIARRIEALDVEIVHADDLIVEDELVAVEDAPRDSTTAILDRVKPDAAPRPAEAEMHRDLAIAFLEMERFDAALAELEKALAADPAQAGATLTVLGRCHLLRGAPDDAADGYRRALAATSGEDEASAAVHFELAGALLALGDRPGALAHYREAERRDPEHRDVFSRIASLVEGRAADGPAEAPRAEARP